MIHEILDSALRRKLLGMVQLRTGTPALPTHRYLSAHHATSIAEPNIFHDSCPCDQPEPVNETEGERVPKNRGFRKVASCPCGWRATPTRSFSSGAADNTMTTSLPNFTLDCEFLQSALEDPPESIARRHLDLGTRLWLASYPMSSLPAATRCRRFVRMNDTTAFIFSSHIPGYADAQASDCFERSCLWRTRKSLKYPPVLKWSRLLAPQRYHSPQLFPAVFDGFNRNSQRLCEDHLETW
ncbi:hypothetical protein CALCODRAFT_363462 [Calocera cornea HHB12733]|uniref:Uncharacterized protein n=1 Tax=Calocera cornea HHB12733 TaxID=1353952 RepID=A0A165J869_9BASI|nr:hypothetical protein CALCODRAFT_363462 [Calocera cornea HHB12733]